MNSKENDNSNNPSQQDSPILFNMTNQTEVVKYYKQMIPVNIHHFYIFDEIGPVIGYIDMINIIKTAEPHDTIYLYLNTPGGDLFTTIQIISAITQSEATVITSIEGEVCSAGTFIFLSGHRHIINKNCAFMIHNYSHLVAGKGNEVMLRVKFSEVYFKKLIKDIYSGFLTEKEIEDVLAGKDLWMDSDELIKRLDAKPHDNITTEIEIETNIENIDAINSNKKPVKKKAKRIRKKIIT